MADAPENSIPQGAPEVQGGSGWTANVSPSVYGAGIGQALEGVGSKVESFAMQEKRWADQERTQNAYADAQVASMSGLDQFHKEDLTSPDKLIQAHEKVSQQFNDNLDKIGAGLTNDHQRSQWAAESRRAKFSFERQLQGAYTQQSNRLEVSGTNSRLKIEQQHAAMLGDQPVPDLDNPGQMVNSIDASIARQKQMIADMGKHQQMDPDQVEQLQAKAVNDTHVSVLRSMTASGVPAQKLADYLSKNKDGLFPQEQEMFGRQIGIAVNRQTSDAMVHDAAYDDKGRPLSAAESYARLASDPRLGKDPAVDAEAQRKLQTTINLHESAVKAVEKDASDTIDKAIRSGQVSWDDPRMDPLKAQLSTEDYHKLAGYYANPDKANIKTNLDHWSRLESMPPEQLAKYNLVAEKPFLSPEDYKAFYKKQQEGLGGGGAVSEAKAAQINEVYKHTLLSLETPIDPNASTTTNIKQAADNEAFKYALHTKIREEEAFTQKPVPPDRMQKIGDELIRPGPDGIPVYKNKALMDRPFHPTELAPEDAKAWTTTLRDPHSPAFDNSVAKLQRWLGGVEEDGFQNTKLPDQAQKVISSVVSDDERGAITVQYMQKNNGHKPNDAQVLGIWASHQKRTAAPLPPPELGIIGKTGEWIKGTADSGLSALGSVVKSVGGVMSDIATPESVKEDIKRRQALQKAHEQGQP